jgi:hypothetical protein
LRGFLVRRSPPPSSDQCPKPEIALKRVVNPANTFEATHQLEKEHRNWLRTLTPRARHKRRPTVGQNGQKPLVGSHSYTRTVGSSPTSGEPHLRDSADWILRREPFLWQRRSKTLYRF